MKTLATLLILFVTTFGYSQTTLTETDTADDNNVNVSAISYSVDSVEELKTINWIDIRDVFNMNKEDEVVKLSVSLNLPESKHKFKSTFTVSGETKNIDELIENAQKGVKSLIKISEKYKN